MTSKRKAGVMAALLLLGAGCAPKRVQAPPAPAAPPPPKLNIFALLQDSDGKAGRIVVRSTAGEREIGQINHAVQVQRLDMPPGAPYRLEKADVERLFGAALAALPAAEVRFVLYFHEASDQLTVESQAQFPAILAAIAERRSTAVTVTGHTDTTGDRQSNYQLGLKRAERVARFLQERGLEDSSVLVSSHGQGDLIVKTLDGVSEARNRRVEVVVR